MLKVSEDKHLIIRQCFVYSCYLQFFFFVDTVRLLMIMPRFLVAHTQHRTYIGRLCSYK